jgi:hypothetical protein
MGKLLLVVVNCCLTEGVLRSLHVAQASQFMSKQGISVSKPRIQLDRTLKCLNCSFMMLLETE